MRALPVALVVVLGMGGVFIQPAEAETGCAQTVSTVTTSWTGGGGGDSVEVEGIASAPGVRCAPKDLPSPPTHVVESADHCFSDAPGAFGAIATCLGIGSLEAEACVYAGDMVPRLTQIQIRQPDGSLGEPEMNSVLACTEQAPAVAVAVTDVEFRALPLTPSAIWVGPPGGWLPVNMVNVVYTDAAVQTLPTTILGQAVLVRATPVSYSWDFGDGKAPLVTKDPGKPHPNHTVSTTYRKVGVYTATMTTTWSGEFSLDGGATYTAIVGTAQTVSTGAPVTVTELRSFLVDDLES